MSDVSTLQLTQNWQEGNEITDKKGFGNTFCEIIMPSNVNTFFPPETGFSWKVISPMFVAPAAPNILSLSLNLPLVQVFNIREAYLEPCQISLMELFCDSRA